MSEYKLLGSMTTSRIVSSHRKNVASYTILDTNTTYSHTFSVQTLTCPYTLYLFGLHRANSLPSKNPLKIYSCKIYDGDTLVRDYIPCKQTDNGTTAYGLYDKVNSKFYGNASGKGAFNGGAETYTYPYATSVTATATASTGYTFSGWVNAAGTTVSTSANYTFIVPAANTYIKAVAKANTYTISYNGNTNTGGSTASSSHTYGTSKALTQNGFVKLGYTFAGWATSASGAVVYSNGQSVSNLSSTQGATVTLYAKWTANTYTINYNANGGAGTTASSSHTYDASKNLTANGFTRSGYRFLGWSTSNTATSATYTDKASVKNLATSGSITLYAVWQKVYVIQVKSNINGAAGVLTGGGTYDANKSVTLTAYAMKGYEFLHWLKDGATFSGNDTNVVTISATSDSTYTAVFAEAGVKINNSAIRMECGSGTVYGMVSSKNVVKNGTQYVAVSASPSSGYKFTGWKIGDTLSTTYTTADALIPLSEVRNKVITAVFASSTVTASSVAELGEIVVNTELFASSIIDSSSCSITVNANISGAVGVLSGGGSYALNGSATLKAYAKKGYQLAYWLKDGKVFANNNTNQITVTVTNDCTYTAVFIESGVKINGVAVDSICTDDASITACGDVAMSTIVKDDVTYVVVTVTPSAGYKFVGWAIDGVISTKYIEDTCAFAYSDVKDKLITARFEKIDKSNINDDVDNS